MRIANPARWNNFILPSIFFEFGYWHFTLQNENHLFQVYGSSRFWGNQFDGAGPEIHFTLSELVRIASQTPFPYLLRSKNFSMNGNNFCFFHVLFSWTETDMSPILSWRARLELSGWNVQSEFSSCGQHGDQSAQLSCFAHWAFSVEEKAVCLCFSRGWFCRCKNGMAHQQSGKVYISWPSAFNSPTSMLGEQFACSSGF